MFNIGNKLKIKQSAVESEYAEWRGSQVYDAMKKNAEEKRFEVVGMSGADYIIRRLEDNAELPYNKDMAHTNFEVVT